MDIGTLRGALADSTVSIPIPQIGVLLKGSPEIVPYLVTAILLTIYLFLESLNNVESGLAGSGITYDGIAV